MPSTFSTNVLLEKQATGENNNSWGILLNQVLDQVDRLAGGHVSVSVAGGADVTLNSTQRENAAITLTGLITANINVIFPANGQEWNVLNNTTGAFTLTCKTAAGGGVRIGQGQRQHIYGDGTNIVSERFIGQDQQEIFGVSAGTSTAYTLTLSPAVAAHKTGRMYRVKFHQANTNTTPTLTVDGLSAKTIVDNDGSTIEVGRLALDSIHDLVDDGTNLRIMTVAGDEARRSTANTFAERQIFQKSIETAKAANVASAGETDIWGTGGTTGNGNLIHITGTATVTSLGTAPQAGCFRRVICDGAITFVHGANLDLPGNANIVAAAGDRFEVWADSTVAHVVMGYQREAQPPLVGGAEVISATTHSPGAADNGKTFVYTNGAGCTITLPRIDDGTAPAGYGFSYINDSGAALTFNRGGTTDTIDPTATTFQTPNNKGLNKGRMVVANSKWFTGDRWFRSANTALPTANTGQTNLAHNLGATPTIMQAWFRCATADNGYEVGDEVQFSGGALIDTAGSAAGWGIALQGDGTNVSYAINGTSLGRGLPNETTGAPTGLTMGSWEFFVLACYPGL